MSEFNSITVKGEIFIRQQAISVFDFLSKPENDQIWRSEINEVHIHSCSPESLKFTEFSKLSNREPNHALEFESLDFQLNKIVKFQTVASSPFYQLSVREVIPQDEKNTLVRYALTFETSIVKKAIGFSLPKFIISMKAKKDLNVYLNRLKSHLERNH